MNKMKTQMTISRALKEKSRIIEKLDDLRKKIEIYNAVDIGRKRPLNVSDMISQCSVLEDNLLRIKAAIAAANVPIERELAELLLVRSLISFYNGLNTEETREETRYLKNDERETVTINRDVIITQVDVLKKVEELRQRLDAAQDIVDEFNATHRIEVELV